MLTYRESGVTNGSWSFITGKNAPALFLLLTASRPYAQGLHSLDTLVTHHWYIRDLRSIWNNWMVSNIFLHNSASPKHIACDPQCG